jgi:hypothetical protein
MAAFPASRDTLTEALERQKTRRNKTAAPLSDQPLCGLEEAGRRGRWGVVGLADGEGFGAGQSGDRGVVEVEVGLDQLGW